ncbi:MAG TPA: HNH endonuclease signature motif containing protein [Rhizomicrobium sp.]|nr:HNH endonuclease signature motif containing protein [Rhizomicrobium sp.]
MALKTIGPRVRALEIRAAKPPPKTADPHYLTPEHQVWAEAVKRRADYACQWPGCGRRERRMFADHIVEKRDGGALFDLNNGQCLCGKHHSIKSAKARSGRMGMGV